MKNEIPLSRTTAPMAMAIALPPDRLPPPEVLVFDRTWGAAVVVGVLGPDGRPGENGLLVSPGAATAPGAGAKNSAAPTAPNTATRRTATAPSYRSSGSAIAWVSGGFRYGCSSSTCSSWYTLSALTAQMSFSAPSRMLSTARIAVSIEWSELL
jgi:hypothetical protein